MVVRGKDARVFLSLASSITLTPNTFSSRNSSTGEVLPMLWNRWMVSYCQQSYMRTTRTLPGRTSPNEDRTIGESCNVDLRTSSLPYL